MEVKPLHGSQCVVVMVQACDDRTALPTLNIKKKIQKKHLRSWVGELPFG